MPLRPVHCWARSRVRPISPAFDAEYAACGSPAVVSARMLETLTMLLPGCITAPAACAIQ